jgi:hypothetical protein
MGTTWSYFLEVVTHLSFETNELDDKKVSLAGGHDHVQSPLHSEPAQQHQNNKRELEQNNT